MLVDIRIIRRRKRLLRQTAEQSHILLYLCYLFGRKAVADVIFTAVQLLSDLFSDAHPAFTREINADVSDKVHTCFVGRSYFKHRFICRLRRRIEFYIVVDKEVVR